MADRLQRCDWCDAETGRCDEDAIRSADEESVICGECKTKEDQRVQPDPKLMTAEELAAVAEGYREFGANEYPVGKLLGHIAAQAAALEELRHEASSDEETESIHCPSCGHDAFEHANDSRIVGCEHVEPGEVCGCRWLLWEILRYAANKVRIAKHGEPFDDKYHEKMGFRG